MVMTVTLCVLLLCYIIVATTVQPDSPEARQQLDKVLSKHLNVTCADDGFHISIQKADIVKAIPKEELSELTLADYNCRVKLSGDNVLFHSPFSKCRTEYLADRDEYRNFIIHPSSVGFSPFTLFSGSYEVRCKAPISSQSVERAFPKLVLKYNGKVVSSTSTLNPAEHLLLHAASELEISAETATAQEPTDTWIMWQYRVCKIIASDNGYPATGTGSGSTHERKLVENYCPSANSGVRMNFSNDGQSRLSFTFDKALSLSMTDHGSDSSLKYFIMCQLTPCARSATKTAAILQTCKKPICDLPSQEDPSPSLAMLIGDSGKSSVQIMPKTAVIGPLQLLLKPREFCLPSAEASTKSVPTTTCPPQEHRCSSMTRSHLIVMISTSLVTFLLGVAFAAALSCIYCRDFRRREAATSKSPTTTAPQSSTFPEAEQLRLLSPHVKAQSWQSGDSSFRDQDVKATSA